MNKTASKSNDEDKTALKSEDEAAANGATDDSDKAEVDSQGEEQKLREDAERQFVTFCGHILKEVANLQPAPGEAVQADAHRALALRSPVTVQVFLLYLQVYRCASLLSNVLLSYNLCA